jgi:hypothetical protein
LVLLAGLWGCGGSRAEGDHGPPPPVALAATCTPRTAGASDLVVDDFEDGDTALSLEGGARGYWYVSNDGTGEQFPATDLRNFGTASLVADGAEGSEAHALYSRGRGFVGWGAFVAAKLNAARSSTCSYDVSASSGLRLSARGSGSLRVNFGTVETTPIVDGGSCTADECSDFGASIELAPAWSVYELRFSDLSQPDWASPRRYDPASLLRLSLWAEQADFELWLDRVSFFGEVKSR